jgi:hypothetical protein
MGWRDMGQFAVAQDRGRWRSLVNAVMNLRVSQNAECFLTSLRPVSFTRRPLLHAVSFFPPWCSSGTPLHE